MIIVSDLTYKMTIVQDLKTIHDKCKNNSVAIIDKYIAKIKDTKFIPSFTKVYLVKIVLIYMLFSSYNVTSFSSLVMCIIIYA